MNQFTKEELENIWESLECDNTAFHVGEELINKIKSMAENYCDHDWENPCCGCPASASFCTKCNRKVYE